MSFLVAALVATAVPFLFGAVAKQAAAQQPARIVAAAKSRGN